MSTSPQHGPHGPGVTELRVVTDGPQSPPEATQDSDAEVETTEVAPKVRPTYELPPGVVPSTRKFRGFVWKLLKPLYTRTGWKWLCVNAIVNPPVAELTVITGISIFFV